MPHRPKYFIKTWVLIILLVISGGLSIELLRLNNLGMIARRAAVITADANEDDTKIKQALLELQHYVSSHMNTGMGSQGVYLQKTYQRAYERAVKAAIAADTAGHALYEQADEQCQVVFHQTRSFPKYTQCEVSKLSGLTGSDPIAGAKTPSVNLFRYNFVSPLWSPDWAGYSILCSILLILILLLRFLRYFAYVVRKQLTKR